MVLRGEEQRAQLPPKAVQDLARFTLGVQYLADTADIDVARMRAEPVDFSLGLDGGDRQHLPIILAEDMADEVVLMQTLHDNDNGALDFIVEAGDEAAVIAHWCGGGGPRRAPPAVCWDRQ